MKYRQIATNIWEDSYALELNDKEFRAFIYFFTNHRVNMVGIYELPDRIIRYTLGATLEELDKIKQKFETDRKYFFYKNWIFINNFSKHNHFSSATSIIDTYINDFNSIPQDILKHFLIKLKLEYTPTIVKKDKVTKKTTVMVMVMVMDKEGRPYPRTEAISLDERVNPDDIPL
jgi:hypothetical protein